METPKYDANAKVRPTDIKGRGNLQSERIDFDDIPVIDIAPIFGDDESAKRRVAAEIRIAAINVGFFYVRNHGIPHDSIEASRQSAEEFYAQPTNIKAQYDVNNTKRHKGYVPVGGLSADPTIVDLQEGYEVGIELPEDDPDFVAGSVLLGPNVWPVELPEFRRNVYGFFEHAMELGKRMYRLIALALGLNEDFFEPMLTKPCAQLRILYYPPTDPRKAKIGIGAHTDYESFTLLWQNESGLQVQNRAGQWIEAPPIEGTFIINIAGKKRYSMALFFAANHDTVVECLPTCQDEDNPARYPPTHFGYWIENMHSYSYAYRWDERGKLPDPEEEAQKLLVNRERKSFD